MLLREELTPHVVVGTVHHVGSVDELITRALFDQLYLSITQNQLPSERENKHKQTDRKRILRRKNDKNTFLL